MVENDKMNAELAFQAKLTEDVVEENTKLRENIKLLRRKVEMLYQLEQDLSKKNQSNHQVIKMLLAKLKGILFFVFFSKRFFRQGIGSFKC
jgi:hypothetical protein